MSESQPPPLRLLRLDELNMGPEHTIVRPRRPGLLGTSLLCLVFAGIIGRDAWRGGLHGSIAGVLILALCGMAWLGYRTSRRYKRAGAWLLAVGPDHVLIRFRSVISRHLPADLPQVIELPLANVLWARAMERTLEQGSGRDERRPRYEYLDFRVTGADLRPLQAALMEDQRERSRRWFAPLDPSVAVTWDGVLRVEMSVDGASAVPGTRAVLGLLAGRVPVEADGWEHVDIRPVATLSPAAQDAAIRAVGETSVTRALALASGFYSDAPESAAAYVQHLLACPGPAELESRVAHRELASAVDPIPAARLLSPADARPGRTDTVVRPHSPSTLAWALAFLAAAGWVGWKGYTGGMHWGWAALLGGVLGLLGAASLYFWIMTLRPGAWRMAIGDTRMLVRLRDHAGKRARSGDARIVELPYAHVASVRQTAQTVASPAASGGTTSARGYTFLDIRTRGLELSALRDALTRERAMDPRAARYGPAPAALSDDGVLRVLMVSRDEFTRPGIGEVVRLLAGHHVVVDEEATEAVDAAGAPALPPARHEAAVRGLAQAGQTWDAVQLARTLYGDTLGQANARVRQLAESGVEAGQTA